MFTWTFDAGTNVITGTLNQAVASGAGGTISIGNLDVTANTGIAAPGNGANINVVASGAANSNTSNDATSSFTYSNAPLPIKLTSFSVRASECNAVLAWHSAEERDFDHYTLQHSLDGVAYSDIAAISGKGNNSDYTYVHQAGNGKSFYRLMLTDDNGSINYSNTVSINVDCGVAPVIELIPSPVLSTFSLRIQNAQGPYSGAIAIYNATGTMVHRQAVHDGDNRMDISDFAAGFYVLTLQDASGTTNYKFVKQ